MKVYVQTFDLATPSPKRFSVPPFSDFAIGVKITRAGAETEAEFTVDVDGELLTPEAEKVGGFTIYSISSGAPGQVKYTVTCGGQTFELTQVADDSAVLEKKTNDVKTEYVVAIGSVVDGVLSRAQTSAVTEIDDYALEGAFSGNQNIRNVGFPNLTTIDEGGMKEAFNGCSALVTVDFSKLSSVGTDGLDGAFSGCTSLEIVLFQNSAAVPAISENTFTGANGEFKAIVPDALYEDWIADETWSALSSHVTKVSDYAAVMTNYSGQDNMDD